MAFDMAKWHKERYTRYSLILKNDEDAELIKRIEENKQNGIGPSESIKKMIKE